MATSFVLNDETKCTSHGFYVLNAGIDLNRYRSNPVMLDNHNTDRLIGRWENLRVEDGKMLADPVFDEGTALGKERKGQVERGFLRGASLGIMINSAEMRLGVDGQSELYVTSSSFCEASTCPVPSNAGALCMAVYDSQSKEVPERELSAHLDKIVKLSAGKASETHIKQLENMERITLSAEAYVALGIKESDDAAAMSAAIVRLSADKAALAERVTALDAAATAAAKVQAEELVTLAVKQGKIAADKQQSFVALAVSNFELAKATIEAIPEKQSLSAQVKPIVSGTIPQDRDGWSHLHWLKDDPEGLSKIRSEHPEAYAEIIKKRN